MTLDYKKFKLLFYTSIGAIAVTGLYFSSLYNYLLFHTLIEFITISIAFALFILTWNTRKYMASNYLRLLGIGYGFIAVIDLIHAFAYKGMNIFPGYGANLPTQLWIAARYFQAVTLIAASLFMERKVKDYNVFTGYAGVVLTIVAIIFSGNFPACFIDGKGLTPFKINSEYVITILLLISLFLLFRKRKHFKNKVFIPIVASIICTVVSEMSFTEYISVYGFANMVGHFAKLFAFGFIYQAILVTGLREPFELIFRDLKQAEEELRTINEELTEHQHQIELRDEEIQATSDYLKNTNEQLIEKQEVILLQAEDLKDANAAKDKFFSIIAHDLRGPFSGFLGLTEIMAEELRSLTITQIQEFSVDMNKSATNLYRLLENLLQWSKMQQGSISFNPELLQLLQVIEECITMVIEQAKGKGIDITYDMPGDLKVFADSNMLQTIIRNLVSNAMKFTPKGGKICVSAKVIDDKNIEIAVKDTGIGMTGEMVNNLFRLDIKTNREGTDGEPSSGLGLLLCKEFVEKLGGRIWVESEEGKGSEFKFTLPIGN